MGSADGWVGIEGAEELARVTRALRGAGSGGRAFRKEMLSSIRKIAGGPLRKAARESWKTNMPHRGGLSRRGLRMTIRTNTRNGASLGVRMVTKSSDGYAIGSIDAGHLRHPVFGNKKAWVDQSVKPGVITKALEDAAPDVRIRLAFALDALNRRIESA